MEERFVKRSQPRTREKGIFITLMSAGDVGEWDTSRGSVPKM